MVFSIFALLSVVLCWKGGGWRRWKEYYPTMLYFYIGDLACDILMYNRPLWAFGQFSFNYPFLDLIITAFLYPSTTILFLTYFPEKRRRQPLYLLLWAGIYSSVELIGYLVGDFKYFNSWNIGYSVLFNLVMFPMLRLHYKHQLLVWPVSTALAFAMVLIFKVNLAR
ncbi:hypothetical protein SAMN02745823_00963 [Sporobacter termitidis DSM 10068]|uniref:Uncharacterized protein n=1 Tax=Sporobacter termitidis DSM 10068 TaxID=1123282 RepID=A0A1M5VRC3_9FIRM|nr:CBO0543 family protein [Sporobacter termitidis]SHH77473.1 hypothetical protein SAMN02745823_00963 [Sporobacter termitidis DSM 10068]